jgi:hypothetical protein
MVETDSSLPTFQMRTPRGLIRRFRENRALIACAAFFMVLGFWLSLTARYLSRDEPWILQVVSRMQSGEILYRDVFYGATPLGAYLTLGMTRLLGADLWVIKFATVLSCLCAYLVSVRITHRLTGVRSYDIFFAIAMLLYGLPVAAGLYQPLATLFLLLCFAVILRWSENPHAERSTDWRFYLTPALAGVSAGLCFVTKQNVGIYALVASLMALLTISNELKRFYRRPEAPTDRQAKFSLFTCGLLTLVGFASVVSVTMIPVILNGGLEKFLDYGFLNKRTYLDAAGVSYWDGVRRFLLVPMVRPWQAMLMSFLETQIFLTPAIALFSLAMAFAFGEKSKRSRGVIVISLAATSVLTIYPRADADHISFAAPGFIIAAIYSWHLLKPRMAAGLAWLLRIVLWVLILASISLKLMLSYRDVTSTEYVWSNLPHLRYKLLQVDYQAQIQNQARWLIDQTAGEPTLILSPDASLYYLLSGLKNPTPFDFPLLTAFGTSGVSEVKTALAERRIRRVCVTKIDWPLAPVELEKYVESRLQLGTKAGSCSLYRVEK